MAWSSRSEAFHPTLSESRAGRDESCLKRKYQNRYCEPLFFSNGARQAESHNNSAYTPPGRKTPE